ncbi:hypothetical protein DBB29_24910 [Pandoraea cepalis]|uniref:Chromosome partitioning protein ParB n=1 Tax=Pandoraea cepalis TaxID=2508294 RepID=A0AAW7MGM9_9BURK|nr:hypothetical protein [Pandoraea cepalis]MDN4571903.1 hypothetical protein [Pandoraea cepalis]MDN4581357.1 hypothetical protein [Pandoraea cepalis]
MNASKSNETIYVPYKLLTDSADNVNNGEVITPELAKEYGETILANDGLLQNLLVTFEDGLYPVVGGRKRKAGLAWLIEQGTEGYTDEYAVPVKIVAKKDAKLASLAENVSRRPMHPAKQFRAIKELADEGRTFAFIARTFSTSISKVKGMLKLTAVSPTLFNLFEEDKITVEEMEVLTLAETHAEQEAAFESYKGYWNRRPDHLRNLIVKQERNAKTDPHVKFVTLQAYEQAGGRVRRDLFEGEDAGYILDSDILHRLEREKLEAIVADVKAEGWKWVEISVSGDEAYGMERIGYVERTLTEEESGSIKALVAEADAAKAARDAAEENEEVGPEEYEALEQKLDDVRDRVERAQAALREYDPKLIEHAGAYVGIGRDGELHIERGLVRREDRVAIAVNRGDGSEVTRLTKEAAAEVSAKQKKPHSEALLRRLSAHHSIALQAEVAANPEAAFVIALEALVGSHFYRGGGESIRKVSVTEQRYSLERDANDLTETEAAKALAAIEAHWKKKLPATRKGLMAALSAISLEERLALFAFVTAVGIGGVVQTAQHPSRLEALADEMEVLAGIVSMDMKKWWKPTATTYLSFVSRAQIGEVIKEAVSKEAAAEVATMKKSDAVKHAEKLLADTGWLPKMMRTKKAVEAVKPKKTAKPAAPQKKRSTAPNTHAKPGQPKPAPAKAAAQKSTGSTGGNAAKSTKPTKPATKTTSR